MSVFKKRWAKRTPLQRVRLIIGGIIQITLLAAALKDIRRRSATEIKGGKRLWTMLAFVNTIGPLTYFLFGRKKPAAG